MPRDAEWRETIRKTYERIAAEMGIAILGWRDNIPTDNSTLGVSVKPTEPVHMQVFLGKGKNSTWSTDDFERKLYMLRKSVSAAIYSQRERRISGYYPVSISCRS